MSKLISQDAMFCGGSLFGMMKPGSGELTFRMKASRPTDRTRKALDELVGAGLISVEPFNQFGGLVYRPLTQFKRPSEAMAKRVGHWPITEPIPALLSKGGNHDQ